MRLREAYRKAVIGDEILCSLEHFTKETEYISESAEIGVIAAMADDWYIIPAKKEMVDYERIGKTMFDMNDVETRTTKKYAVDIAQASAESRDILYGDLIKLIGIFLNEHVDDLAVPDVSTYRIEMRDEIKKINVVLNPDTYIQGT